MKVVVKMVLINLFLKWTNTNIIKVDDGVTLLTNNLYTCKHKEDFSSPDVKSTLHNIRKHFRVVSIDKPT